MRVAILTANGWAEIDSIKGPDGALSGVLRLEDALQPYVGSLAELVEDFTPDPAETRALNAIGLEWASPYEASVRAQAPAPRNRAERRAARRRR